MKNDRLLSEEEEIKHLEEQLKMADKQLKAALDAVEGRIADERKKTLQAVGKWLLNKYKEGWANHGVDADSNPECFELTFFDSDLKALRSGNLPIDEVKK